MLLIIYANVSMLAWGRIPPTQGSCGCHADGCLAKTWLTNGRATCCLLPAVTNCPVSPFVLQLLLPTDVVIADKFDPEANAKVVKADAIPDGWMVSAAAFWGGCVGNPMGSLHG